VPTVLLGVTGCIAAYKACEILRGLQRRGVTVRVAMTEHATRFVGPLTLETLSGQPVYLDPFAPGAGAAMPHVRWTMDADLLLVAPATANSLAKMAHGLADDALSTLYLATRTPVVVAPAMNVEMWRHPAVLANVEILRARGVTLVEPASGYLACGTEGEGRLADPDQIVDVALARLSSRLELAGLTVVITAGPTREALDPVRFVSNRSSGRMGCRLAEVARDRGARVVLVAGPLAVAPPWGVEHVPVVSADEMAEAVSARAPEADVVVMAAAVCDHRPARRAEVKLKKEAVVNPLPLEPTPDIAARLGAAKKKGRYLLVGFAAETGDLLENARRKLAAKQLDLIVANDVSGAETGLEVEANAALLVDARGQIEDVPRTSKRELAERIWDRVVALRSAAATAVVG
jgi:phosphopantothenoylcysteine decarboxylase / phosphopantothenate---cysteine ligase